jgi:hypothetical protein
VVNQTSYDTPRYTDLTVEKTHWARLPFGVRMTICGLAVLLPLVGGVFAVGALMGDSGAETVDRYASIVTSDSKRTTPPADGIALAAPEGDGFGISAGLGGAPGMPGVAGPGAGVGLVGVVPGSTMPAAGPGIPGLPGVPGAGTPTFDAEMPIGGTPVDPSTDYEPVDVPPSPPAPVPVVETTTVTETEAIPFETDVIRDPSMPRRTHEVRTPGEQGERTYTYEVTTTDGQQTDKRLVSQAVTKDPVTRVIAVGTGRRDDCDTGDDDGSGDPDGDWGKAADDRNRTYARSCDAPSGS